MSGNLSSPSRLRAAAARALPLAAAVAAFGALSCDQAAPRRARAASARMDSTVIALTDIRTVDLRARPTLVENSAAAASATQPGVVFTINDSGNDPLLFAVDTLGADRGVWRVTGARNIDWESAAIGPCGTAAAGAPPGCVYIGDTGDNQGVYRSHRIYRVSEPEARDGKFTGHVTPESIVYSFPDRRHDVEAMYVAPDGDVFLVTKRPVADAALRLRPALVFRIPAAAWRGHDPVVADLVDSLSIVPGSMPLRTVTDASLSPDARHLAVRTYAEVYVYATEPRTGMVRHDVAPTICNLIPLAEWSGEGVAWANNAGRLIFTSEGRREPLRMADCRLPD